MKPIPFKIYRKSHENVFCYQNRSDLLGGKNCSSDREKLMKFKANGWEFAKILRSLEQCLKQNVFLTRSQGFSDLID